MLDQSWCEQQQTGLADEVSKIVGNLLNEATYG